MDSLLIQLRQLKLAAMASALEQQRLAPHTYAELSFDERLGLLVEQEHLARITPLTTLAQTSQSAP